MLDGGNGKGSREALCWVGETDMMCGETDPMLRQKECGRAFAFLNRLVSRLAGLCSFNRRNDVPDSDRWHILTVAGISEGNVTDMWQSVPSFVA